MLLMGREHILRDLAQSSPSVLYWRLRGAAQFGPRRWRQETFEVLSSDAVTPVHYKLEMTRSKTRENKPCNARQRDACTAKGYWRTNVRLRGNPSSLMLQERLECDGEGGIKRRLGTKWMYFLRRPTRLID